MTKWIDETHDLKTEKLYIPDIQLLRGLVIYGKLKDEADGHFPPDNDMGGIVQVKRILGYLNKMEDIATKSMPYKKVVCCRCEKQVGEALEELKEIVCLECYGKNGRRENVHE